jgi:hypothetical protein
MGFMKSIQALQLILVSSHKPFPYCICHGSTPYSAGNPAKQKRLRIGFL